MPFAHTPDTCPTKHWNPGNDICADCGVDLNDPAGRLASETMSADEFAEATAEFTIKLGMDVRAYGNVTVKAHTVHEAVAALNTDFIVENFDRSEVTEDQPTGITIIDIADELGGTGYSTEYDLRDIPSDYDPAPVTINHRAIALLKTARDLVQSAITTHIYDEANGDQIPADDPYVQLIADIDTLMSRAPADSTSAILSFINVEIERTEEGIANMRALHENPGDPDGPAEDDEAYTIDQCLQDQKAALERVRAVVAAGGPAPVSDADYLARFPAEHRATADRAYQDGYVDGVSSAQDGKLAVIVDGGMVTDVVATGAFVGLPVTVIDYDAADNAHEDSDLVDIDQGDGNTKQAEVLHCEIVQATIAIPTEEVR